MKNYLLVFILIVLSCNNNSNKTIPANDAGLRSEIKYPLPNTNDSLLDLLKILPDDSNRVNVLKALGFALSFNNPDTSIILANQMIEISGKIKWKKGLAISHGTLAVFYLHKSEFPKALDHLQQSEKIYEELNDKDGERKNFSNLGVLYSQLRDYQKSLDYNFKALALNEELGNKTGIGIVSENIGGAFREMGKYDKSLEFHEKALNIFKETRNIPMQSSVYANIGGLYSSLYKNELAKGNDDVELFKKGFLNFQKAYGIDSMMGNQKGLALDIGNLGVLYTNSYKYKQALDYTLRSLAIANKIGSLDYQEFSYQGLSTIYENSKIPLPDSTGGKLLSMEEMRLRSLHYYKSYINIRDTLFSQENKKQLVRKEMNYEFDKKEAEQKAEQDKKDALTQEELKQKEQQRNYFIGGFALVLILAGFIFRSYRQKQKANEIISQQKLMVEEKQKEILDSIHYAKRIQKSMMPTEKYIVKSLKKLTKEN